MEQRRREPAAPASVQKILALLTGLQRHPAGSLIYDQIRRILVDTAQETLSNEQAYAAVIGILLDAIADRVPGHDPMRLQIRLVQKRLQPPLLGSELRSLRHYVERWSQRLDQFSAADDQVFRHALGPLLDEYRIDDGQDADTPPPGRAPQDEAKAPAPDRTAAQPSAEPVGETVSESLSETAAPKEEPTPVRESEDGTQREAEQRMDSAYRHHLDEKNREVQELQNALSRKIHDTIQQHQQVGVSLEVALAELQRQERVDDVARTKEVIARIVQQLLDGNRELTAKLDSTYHTLEQIADGSRRLSDELSRVRQLSLTDELTNLPNRRAFQRRLEDEIARANRYGYPLTLAVIDLDEFKKVNDTYGHAIGDRILRDYAAKILSIFRRLDMVARHGGEEFAVLLPNTDLQGALRALHKVRGRIPEVSIETEAGTLPMPTFSAGVASYHPGESADSFVARTDTALYEAKRNGRNRVEVAADDRRASVEPVVRHQNP